MLERAGFDVVHAEDGVEAVQAVLRAPSPTRSILDVQMPRVSGYVAARVLKDDWQTADIPVAAAHLARTPPATATGARTSAPTGS